MDRARHLRILWALLLALGCDSADDAPDPLPALRAEGTRIVDADGDTVLLRGVNLGGWLYNETWITQIDYALASRIHVMGQREPIADAVDEILRTGTTEWVGPDFLDTFRDALAQKVGADVANAFVDKVRPYAPALYDDSDLPLRRKLSARFGDDTRDELLDVFQSAWITREDVAWIAAQGFNVVRVPMGYRSLVTGPDVERPTSLAWNERAFRQIARLLDWCLQHRIYAILDLQESPGGHNDYAGRALLYEDPALQELTVTLWVELARRFGGHSAVAAYSLLAEPFGAPDAAARDAMYDRLVKAIRGLGDDHLLVIHDGFLGMQTLPAPASMGWTDVVYSTHIFEFSATSYDDYDFLVNWFHDPVFAEAQARQDVPYFIGSFSARHDEDWAYDAATLLIDWYTRRDWSWAVWTYKRIDDPIAEELFGRSSQYGVRGVLVGDLVRPDVFDDDLETLRARMSGYRDLRLDPNPRLLPILAGPLVAPGD